ncbi:putative bifunctional diguanylate cyclase/phosphodiesterase [Roseateles sp. PN1]|uniref:putative bifunctional diguanylate cyclase/phosphodiesterase n=1 Tax=Roseateles sp. PN1 TaxID=3137372 RepID=UPI003139F489
MTLRLPAFLNLRRLEGRMVVPFLALLAVVQVSSWTITDASIRANTEQTVRAELQTSQRVLEHLLTQQVEQRAAILRDFEHSHAIRQLLANADKLSKTELELSLTRELESKNQRLLKAGLIAYTDSQFKLVAATAPEAGDFTARLPALVLSMAKQDGTPTPWQSHLLLRQGRAYLIVAVQVKAVEPGGWLLMADELGAGPLQELRMLSQVKSSFMLRLHPDEAWHTQGSVLNKAQTDALDQQNLHEAGAIKFKLGADDMRGMLRPLVRDGEQELAVLLLRNFDRAFETFDRLRLTLAALTLLGLLTFALASLLMARRISTPIRSLANTADRLGHGDYDTPVQALSGAAEVSDLARSLESMRQGIRQRDAALNELAFKDALTGLTNRAGFSRLATRLLARPGGHCAVLVLGLDRFKHVNDVQGHEFGDLLLRKVAERLGPLLQGDDDVLARLNGDEFALLLNLGDEAAALGLADAIRRNFERPMQLGEQTVDLSAGIGISLAPQHGVDGKLLLTRAGLAMMEAKKRQSGSLIYTPGMDVASQESLSLLGELRHAVEAGELRLYLQPKVDLGRSQVLGAEALVRWQHPVRGLVPPLHFIPFAEQTGFIRTLTTWVIAASIRAWAMAQAQGLNMRISVNLSTRDLLDQDLPDKIMRLLQAHGATSQALCLEITESAIMDDPQRAMGTLAQLSELGFKLSIDDFGTGYSSLAYLKILPVNELKIDKSFVLNMEHDLGDAKIVRSTVELAHNLGLTVVAEGVESAKAWSILAALGCDEGQGFFIARPMPEAHFFNWAKGWQAPDLSGDSTATVLEQLKTDPLI